MGDCVIPNHVFNREKFWRDVLRSLRDYFFETAIGRFFRPRTSIVYLSPAETISSYAPGNRGERAPLEEGFLDGFDLLPDVVIRMIAEEYRQFGSPLLNLRLVSPRFHEIFKTARRTVGRHAKITLHGSERAFIIKGPHKQVEMTHNQISANLNSVTFVSLQIELLSGEPVASAFHIPEVVCRTLFISIIDSVESSDQLELLLQQTLQNEHLEVVYLRARSKQNHSQIQQALCEITRSPDRLEPSKKYHISISRAQW